MQSKLVVLLVEDDDNDAFFLERSLRDAGFKGKLRHLTSAARARAYLEGAGEFADRANFPFPKLIIADSALPSNDSGIDLLEWMRGAKIEAPFVVLSGAVSEDMRSRAMAAGAANVLTKSTNFRETGRILRELLDQSPRA
jgi:DNA-binding response OmpR family regulator